jgi:tRNA threonylcarbamoyladenosine biosynthesis protein TsaE
MIFTTNSEKETVELGRKLARGELIGKEIFGFGSPLAFYGDLGSGKTAMIRGVCLELGVDPTEINSPTFNIVNEYNAKNGLKICHFDLYRIRAEEWFGSGFDEYVREGNLCVVEWAENLPESVAKAALGIKISGSGLQPRTIEIRDSIKN